MTNLTTLKLKGDMWEWYNNLDEDTQEEIIINAFAKSKKIIIE